VADAPMASMYDDHKELAPRRSNVVQLGGKSKG
jgi:hypothetical protein